MLPQILLACNPESTEPTTGQTTVTWHADIRAIVESSCSDCHTSGGNAPFTLETHAEVAAWGDAVVDAVSERRMPPWGQDPDCRPALGSLWLSDEHLAAFQTWQSEGYPEGDEADYIAPEPAESFDPGAADIILTAAAPINVDISLDDDYRCMLIGEPLSEELMIRGSLTVPENLEVAHHALLYAIPEGYSDDLAALDAAVEGEGYTCFGDTGLDDAQTVAGWAPGNEADWLPDGAAIRVPAGSQFVLQMHYNNAALDSDDPQSDLTEVQLWTLKEDPTHLVVSFPVAKTGISIDAGDPASVQVQTQRIPANARIIATSPHMHLRGTALSTRLIRSDGTEECIAEVANYDFNWQRGYGFAEEHWIDLSMDDLLEITCTYDNADNPDSIVWGDGSGDEMCLNYLALLMPYHGGEGVCAGYDSCVEGCDDDIYCQMSCLTAGGESCLYCGIGGMFGDCTLDTCYDDILSLYPCLVDCSGGEETGFLDCMYDGCRTEFETYTDCAKTADCAEDYTDCDIEGL